MRRTIFDEGDELFRETVRKFLLEEVTPEYADWERVGRPPREFWKRAAEVGILGIGVPPALGGMRGSTFRHSAIVSEEAQKLGLALGGVRVHTDICLPYFLHFANAEQKSRWVPRLTGGDAVVALALSEPGAGSDMKSMTTKAVRDGDDYIVNGTKTFISNGAGADLVVLAVKTDPSAGRKGISLLVVETDTPGYECGRSLAKLGLKAQDLAELSFTDMRVPVSNLLGEENEGFTYLTSNLAQERLSIAVSSQAAAVAALSETVAQLAGKRIGQRAKFELATCATDIRAGQTLVDQAIQDLEANMLTGADAALAKLYCTELQGRVLATCVRILGPDHYRRSSIVGRGYLDGRVTRIFGGSSEIMKVIVAQDLGV
ncbi:acyl-CoA dehydrogenase [Rhodococcus sp. WS3]|uniref:acyl-CoA dehydrogenase family protein n=1 Tax=unclassified Rhodococcus (in: high G+C Gram-positive bacteria) TaxID=192944 RepID=UPI0011442C15|nr:MULTISPECIES: acyl-CoA dehydrogenase family protein [unclassified Rhodococcus (in: high G+C Gram-positive bacteria)]ROZ46294.1 acyl-CoA dehydrogenase [Rhodococcus sp. WS3]RZL24926.1 MAG: acyl-CoA dehydrogenase [Rhodococcus sp. (in: high G+C Gram-positive bacteria)]